LQTPWTGKHLTNLSQQSTYELVSISNHWTAEPEAVHCTVKCMLPMLKMQWKTFDIVSWVSLSILHTWLKQRHSTYMSTEYCM